MPLNIINTGNKSYQIIYAYPAHPDRDVNKIIEFKNNFGYDAVIKNDNFYFICNSIKDAEFTEIVNENELKELETGTI